MVKIIGVDPGNKRVKVYDGQTTDKFLSDLGEYRDIKLTNTALKDDMVYSYKGIKGFAGTLAARESEFGGSIAGSNKAHPDMVIRVLLALHRRSLVDSPEFNVIVGQPIINHTNLNKDAMKEMLIGKHEFTLNDVTRNIVIHRAEVAPEGISAFWSSPKNGKVRIIDAGSGTVNIATIIDGVYVDKESETLEFGFDTNISDDINAFARRVAVACLKKWNKNDLVYIVGGRAVDLLVPMLQYFPSAAVLRPQVKDENGKVSVLSPIYANAVAFYNIAKKVFV